MSKKEDVEPDVMIETTIRHYYNNCNPECGRVSSRILRVECFMIREVHYCVVIPICCWRTSTPIKDCVEHLTELIGYEFVYEREAEELLKFWLCSTTKWWDVIGTLEPVKITEARGNNRIYLRREVLALAASTWRDKNGKPFHASGIRCHVCDHKIERSDIKEKKQSIVNYGRNGTCITIDPCEVYVCSDKCNHHLHSHLRTRNELERECVEVYQRSLNIMEECRQLLGRVRKAIREDDREAMTECRDRGLYIQSQEEQL